MEWKLWVIELKELGMHLFAKSFVISKIKEDIDSLIRSEADAAYKIK
jgi:hypothetical protein